ncbi:hypothetical protein [Paenirhodobacter enshiensis]|uniref:hypothetical protein n=1 Tax=Paenirhodobacter enshiensis TaxID=1105367 RepID=UPI001268F222|nr:hypothetical protein [Paenirhodobacter enshiensis]
MLGIGIRLGGAERPFSPPAAPVIAIASGSGYAGSVYSSTVAGQWTADGVAIAGATGTAWTMTAAYEGKAIRCGASNVIRMWTPAALTAGQVCWLDPKWSQTVAGGKVAVLPDRFGLCDFVQSNAANQPVSGMIDGYPAAVFTDGSAAVFMSSVVSVAPMWWCVVARYGTGAETTFARATCLVSGAASNLDIRGAAGASVWSGVSASCVDGVPGAAVLPMARRIVSAGPRNATTAALSWRLGYPNTSLSWSGALFEILALSSTPDTATRQKIEGCMAWRNGLAGALPTDHPYRTNAPRIA